MTMGTRRGIAALACASALLAGMPVRAVAWNAATHAFIARDLHRKAGGVDALVLANRIYGANALDLFNVHFTPTWLALQDLLHDPASDLFLDPWREAETPAEFAFAFGVAMHNNTWGADSTAHRSGRTAGRDEGWITMKAAALAPRLAPVLAELGLVLPEETLLLVSHVLVEQGVDLLLVERDPSLAGLLQDTAWARDDDVPGLLARAYADDVAPIAGGYGEAVALILQAEAEFRWSTISYGWALAQANARELVAFAIGTQAEEFLGLEPGSGAALVPVIDWAIGEAMADCAPDFMRELQATRGWVNGRLASHHLRT